MGLIDNCCCPLEGIIIVIEEDAVLFLSGAVCCVIVLVIYWKVVVKQQMPLHSEQTKPSANPRKSRKPKRAKAKSRFRYDPHRKSNFTRQMQRSSMEVGSIKTCNFLQNCSSVQITRNCCCSAHGKPCRGTLASGTKIKNKDRSGKEREASSDDCNESTCTLFHAIYSNLSSGANPADSTVRVLLYSNHASEIEKAAEKLSQENVKILLKHQSSMKLPTIFTAVIARKDGLCNPREIKLPVRHNQEKVFKEYSLIIGRFPDAKDVLPDNVTINYEYWSCSHAVSKSFVFTPATNTVDHITCETPRGHSEFTSSLVGLTNASNENSRAIYHSQPNPTSAAATSTSCSNSATSAFNF